MPTNCEFLFNRLSPVYYSGEKICGNLVLTTNKDLKVESLHVHCTGGAQVEWFEPSRFAQPLVEHNDCAVVYAESVHHQGQEMYIDECLSLSNGTEVITAGRHVYPFALHLPASCPATCSQKHGDISYSVNLLLRRRSKHDKHFEHRFVVKNRLDLNAAREELKLPGKMNQIVTFAASKLNSAARTAAAVVHFCTPRTGYVPGQIIPCCLQLSKSTNAAPTGTATATWKHLKFQVRLCQKYVFRAQLPSAKCKEVIRKLARAKSGGGDGGDRLECCLRLPLLAPMSSHNNGALISVAYHLEALVFTKRKRLLTKLCLPITVGTKALQGLAGEVVTPLFCYDNFKANEENALESSIDHSTSSIPVHSDRSLLLNDGPQRRTHEGLFFKHFRDILYKQLGLAFQNRSREPTDPKNYRRKYGISADSNG